VKRIISTGYSRARAIIEQYSSAMVAIAEALLERESLDGAEVKLLINGGTLPPTAPPPVKDKPETQQVIRPEAGRRMGDSPLPA
jgi:cell division protease FtsH